MKDHTKILNWAADCLIAKKYSLKRPPEIVIDTPWSTVIRFPTAKEDFYLKQTPPSLFLESNIIQLLAKQLHANVAVLIDQNEELHCFLMADAGPTLRQHLKTHFHPDLLYRAIEEFTNLQRSAENHIESFLALRVPDWRLDKLPALYNQLINQTGRLKMEGMTDEELQLLHSLNNKISEQCKIVSQYPIPETIVQPDFNTNNILFDLNTKKITLIDLGEIAITHPFFSLHNFLLQATLHHGIKEQDEIYYELQNACCKNWLVFATKDDLLDAFRLVKKLWPIYAVVAYYRLMVSIDQQALKSYYANRPSQLAAHLREYIAFSNGNQ